MVNSNGEPRAAATRIEPLHLSDAEYDRISRHLDTAQKKQRYEDRRRHQRVPYEDNVVLICELCPSDVSSVQFLFRCRKISAGGLGFLHGMFIHPQTPCFVTLITADKKGYRVKGRVMRCEHIKMNIHDVGVQFDESIDLKKIFSSGAAKQAVTK